MKLLKLLLLAVFLTCNTITLTSCGLMQTSQEVSILCDSCDAPKTNATCCADTSKASKSCCADGKSTGKSCCAEAPKK